MPNSLGISENGKCFANILSSIYSCERRQFLNLCYEKECQSLKTLWNMQRFNEIEFTTYIHYNTQFIHSMSEQFDELIWCQDGRQECCEVVGGLMAVLVNLGLSHTHVEGQRLLQIVIDKFVKRTFENPSLEPVAFLSKIYQSSICAPSQLEVFRLNLMRNLIQYAPHTACLEKAVTNQAVLYTFEKCPLVTKNIFQEILIKEDQNIIDKLNEIITSTIPFNWSCLLQFVSVYVNIASNGAAHLKGAVGMWLSQACSLKNKIQLAAALLCARQACAENKQGFGSYSAWFSGINIRNTSDFIFLFSLLTDLVPHEPVLCLKIHVNKVPFTPPNCHIIVADYVALAKTRLADLNQTTDYLGLFGEYTTTEQEGREADIAKVISHFQQTNEVIKIVLEASLFRKTFYEKVFLAELLKGNDSEHSKFIEKLYSIGKIPLSLYNEWRHLNCPLNE